MAAETRVLDKIGRIQGGSTHPIYGQTPTEIDAYNVVCLIGQGSMGNVYQVQHTTLGKNFALKLMAATLSGNLEALERFRSETRALGQLDHSNIVQAVDAGQWQGRLYLVTELLRGSDFASHISKHGCLDQNQVIPIAMQLCDALSSAHECGFYHRDIKPSNIFLQATGSVKLLDFGLVRCDSSAGLTRAGCFMGTVDYVAPEQAGNPSAANAASDIYSLGCTLIFLLSGQPPFSDQDYPSIAAKIHAHLHQTPKCLMQNELNLEQRFLELLLAMVAKNPENRPSNCKAIADVLRKQASAFSSSEQMASNSSIRSSIRNRAEKSKSSAAKKRLAKPVLLSVVASLAISFMFFAKSSRNEFIVPATANLNSDGKDQLDHPHITGNQGTATVEPKESKNLTDANATSSTLPVSRINNARGVPQLSKNPDGKSPIEKSRPTVLARQFD